LAKRASFEGAASECALAKCDLAESALFESTLFESLEGALFAALSVRGLLTGSS
jgi:hypothetical protein